jgi:hypothetical protein
MVSVRKSEGKRPLGRPRYSLEDNIEMGWDGVGWIHLPQDMDQWQALSEHGNESSGSIKCW